MMLRLCSLLLLLICAESLCAQDVAHTKHKKCLLRGQWQLVRTVNNGTPHIITKDEYDGVITLRCFHRYQEEVIYEGYHWIIKGRWRAYRRKADLEFTRLEYVSGAPPGGVLHDIHFSLYRLDRQHWAGHTETKEEKIQMEYEKIPRVRKAAKAH